MGAFALAMRRATTAAPTPARWLYVPYDQLSHELGPLARTTQDELGVVLVESSDRPSRRPYHKQKLALVLANTRHFALELARRGRAVRHVAGPAPFVDALREVAGELGALEVMRPAERELRAELAPLRAEGLLTELPHEGWLTTDDDFTTSQGKKKTWRMDAFYRQVRQRTGILMEEGKPLGGKYSFDAENRKPWSGEPPAPEPPVFTPDEVTLEVGALVERAFGDHPGELDLTRLPATFEDAERAWSWALTECLPTFGPYEDAMSTASRTVFHTLTSPLINLHRLTPERVLKDALEADVPLASKEGFVRQLIGWREFMRHVHERTDGFRSMPGAREDVPVDRAPGDAGWSAWSAASPAWPRSSPPEGVDGGARPSTLGADWPLPPAYWGAPSGLGCLDHVVEGVMEAGYAHHIERLMVLANIGALLDVSPRGLTDWFWCAFVDAYDWVVEPNVLGMGTFGVGDLFTTKPYAAGSNYINKMSDFCGDCAFDPRKNCPLSDLYWAFIARHEPDVRGIFRMKMMLSNLDRRSDAKRLRDEVVFAWARDALGRGEVLTPEGLPGADD